MGFLSAYDALYSAEARKALLFTWFTRRRQELFSELREQAPIFATPDFLLVSRHQDVKDVLEDHEHFSVKGYAGSEDFVLGKDKEAGHDDDRSFLAGLLHQDDRAWIRTIATQTADTLLDASLVRDDPSFALSRDNPILQVTPTDPPPSARLELPLYFTRLVPLAVVAQYFGVSDPDPKRFDLPDPDPEQVGPLKLDPRAFVFPEFPSVGNWNAALFRAFTFGSFGRYLLPNLGATKAEQDRIQAGQEKIRQVRKLFADHIGTLIHTILLHPPPSTARHTILQRMVVAGRPPQQIARDMIGMINGMVDNTSIAVNNAMDMLLSHPSVLEGASAAARTNHTELLWQYIREALRLCAPVPLLARICRKERPLGKGATWEIRIPVGRRIFVAPCSAMMDEPPFDKPEEFRPDRRWRDEDDLLFGSGWHDCFGKDLAREQIVAMVSSLLRRNGIRRAPGIAGKLVYEETFLPQSFSVEFGPKPVQNALTAIMTLKAPEDVHYRALRLLLTRAYAQVEHLLNKVGTIHFARFVFLDNNTKLALITTYDGGFEDYINTYIELAGPLFDRMLEHMKDAPPLPVRQYRKEFIDYVRSVDVTAAAPFYSAYRNLTVQDIRRREEP